MDQLTLFQGKKPKRLTESAKSAKNAKRQEKYDALTPEHTGQQFPILYADPPWRYEWPVSKNRAIENHYPTMPLEQIKELPIEDIAYHTSLCYMWSTVTKLSESLEVLTAWGFEYRTSFVWVKDKIGMGYWSRGQHELLLLGKRGPFPTPIPSTLTSSVFHAPRLEHSRKPEAVAEMIERQFPNMAKVELFCRRPRPGWSVWGNEVESDTNVARALW